LSSRAKLEVNSSKPDFILYKLREPD